MKLRRCCYLSSCRQAKGGGVILLFPVTMDVAHDDDEEGAISRRTAIVEGKSRSATAKERKAAQLFE